jgi:hypothetical protein
VTDIEGTVTKIICPVYDRPTGACRVMKATLDGGPLSRLLERTVENTLDTRDTQCVLRAG